MAVVLKRDSELAREYRRIKRREKWAKMTEPARKLFFKILFVVLTICIIAFAALICYSMIKVIGEQNMTVAYVACGIIALIGIFAEIKAWKVCFRKKEEKKVDPHIKGAEGEETVTHFIEDNFSNEYFLLNDINVRHNGKSSQFDHIIVCPKGIFCLETKNYSGNYTPNGESWMFYSGRGKIYMDSPQYQSCYHVSILADMLAKEKKHMIPLVVFANKKAKYNGDPKPCPVIYYDQLKETITAYPKVYTKTEAKNIAKKILTFDVGISKFKETKK